MFCASLSSGKERQKEGEMSAIEKTKQSRAKRPGLLASARNEHDDRPAVTALIAGMTHPLVATLEAVRRTILAADPAITEGVKWNSPSFYRHGWFATIGCRKPTQLDIVLHHGVKARPDSTVGETLDDPARLLSWRSKDRALLSFTSDADFRSKRVHFKRIVKQWAQYQVDHPPVDAP
jgi:hypothetical protein